MNGYDIFSPTHLQMAESFSPDLTDTTFTFQKPIAQFDNSSGVTQFSVNGRGSVGIGAKISHQRLTVAGAIGFNNFTDRSPEVSGTLSGARKTVSTSRTMLLNLNWSGVGLAVVNGYDRSTNASFLDLVWVAGGEAAGEITVLKSTNMRGPAARSYSVQGCCAFNLAMGSGIYGVTIVLLGAQ